MDAINRDLLLVPVFLNRAKAQGDVVGNLTLLDNDAPYFSSGSAMIENDIATTRIANPRSNAGLRNT